MTTPFTVRVIFFLLFASFLTGCGQQSGNSNKDTVEKIRVGYLPIAAGLPLFVAVEKGFFKEAGFEVELHRFASSNDLGTAGTAKQVDAMMPFALNAAFDIGVASGTQHKLFGVNVYSDKQPHIVDSFVVTPSSNIQSIEDIRGKRVGAFPGSVTKIFVENILERKGVKPGEYTYLPLGPKDWQAALSAGSIDAASVMEPQLSQIVFDKAGVVLIEGFFAKLMPNVPLSGHWLSSDYINNHTNETVLQFVSAFDKAVDYIRANSQEVKLIYPKYTAIREELLPSISLNIWLKSSEISVSKIQDYIDLLYKAQGLKERVQAKNYIMKAVSDSQPAD